MADDKEPSGFPLIRSWAVPTAAARGEAAYGPMIDALRRLLDDIAGASPDGAMLADLTRDLQAWSATLKTVAVREHEQIFARRLDLPGRGQTMAPCLHVLGGDDNSVEGTVTFGRYFLGGGGAVHGGAIPLLFDEVLGRLANAGGRPRARTAYLHTDFRSITPVGVELSVTGRFVSEQGRKRVLRAELRHGETLCAEAEGLFVELRPGQP